jgi:glycosyltransferase involved in cell wall biosynthesis
MPSSHRRPKLSVVIPAYEEREETLKEIREGFPKEWELLIVDDGSRDIQTEADIVHLRNQGYGAALKSGIQRARAPYVATMDGDGQHTLLDIARLYSFIRYFPHLAMVVGDRRVKERSLKRWLGRKSLNWTASLMAWRWIPDLNSGIRVFKRKVVLGYDPILSNGFSFTTSLTMSMLVDQYPVDWLPIKVHPRRFGHSKVSLVRDGARTLWLILRIGGALRTRGIRRWLRERR